jgi:phage tail sheath protein FI
MPAFTTPDVYVREIKVFPPSVAEVESAVPAFIGYTEKAKKDADNDLILKPTKIYSFTEFEQYYGGPQYPALAVKVTVRSDGGKATELLNNPSPMPDYLLYHSIKLFFDNGGGQCYVVSVGLHQATPSIALRGDTTGGPATKYGLQDGLETVALEDEPTLLVIPESVKLNYADYSTLVQAMLQQCAMLGDRFAILDATGGDKRPGDTVVTTGTTTKEVMLANREAWTGDVDRLKYGAAYYPYLKTTMNPPIDETKINVTIGTATPVALSTLKNTETENYNAAKSALASFFLVLPASGAVTGVYAYTDTNRGVWKAPANVPLSDVLEPVVKLDAQRQGPLNVDPTTGKSINALRAFSGKGTLVWGARTLAGNDNEWRYVNVRRFFNMVEESVKKSTYWAVFESNDANTWVKVRGMIESYLTQKWREGALAGATPKDAFFVRCGLGTTMSAQDILEGRMNVEIGMAVVRPAEFIILKFSHKMQTS